MKEEDDNQPFFEEDDEFGVYDDSQYETPLSKKEAFKDSFADILPWSWWQIALVGGALCVVVILFISKFGTNPDTIGQKIKSTLGVEPSPQQAKIISVDSPTQLTVKTFEEEEKVRLLGLTENPCKKREALNTVKNLKNEQVVLFFDKKVDYTDENGYLVAYLKTKRIANYNLYLLENNLVRGLKELQKADKGQKLVKAAKQVPACSK